MFEVDLEYPAHLRADNTHDNFPLAPESFKIKKDLLSPYQQDLGDNLGVKYGAEKLCLTLYDKQNYVVHGRYACTIIKKKIINFLSLLGTSNFI